MSRPIGEGDRRQRSTLSNVTLDKMIRRTENIVAGMNLATVETLMTDFNFTSEQITKFQELMEVRFNTLMNIK